jgi:hypothetical protein
MLSKTAAKEIRKWPWGYKKIDPSKAAKIAYEKYYEGACCYGVVNGILVPLQEEIGEPYTSLPLEAFRFGHSGVVGWGTTCGTLIGVGIATGFIAGKTGEEILNKVINWYVETPLPFSSLSHIRGQMVEKRRCSIRFRCEGGKVRQTCCECRCKNSHFFK